MSDCEAILNNLNNISFKQEQIFNSLNDLLSRINHISVRQEEIFNYLNQKIDSTLSGLNNINNSNNNNVSNSNDLINTIQNLKVELSDLIMNHDDGFGDYIDEYLRRDNQQIDFNNKLSDSIILLVDLLKRTDENLKISFIGIGDDINRNFYSVANSFEKVGSLLQETIKYSKDIQTGSSSLPTALLQSIINMESILRQLNIVYLGGSNG